LIDQANTTIVVSAAIAAFLLVFTLVATKTLIGQAFYQNRVVNTKKTALKTLKADLNARTDLSNSYQSFVNTPTNLIGGSSTGTGDRDGDNGKIVLDALPPSYDFPALATSLEKILTTQGLQIQSISGTDDEVAQQNNSQSSAPQPVAIPFQLQVSGSYAAIQNLAKTFEASIRPFQIQTMSLSGSQSSMTLSITAQTYYQPAKQLQITTEVVK